MMWTWMITSWRNGTVKGGPSCGMDVRDLPPPKVECRHKFGSTSKKGVNEMGWSFGISRCPKCKRETIVTSSARGTACLQCEETD